MERSISLWWVKSSKSWYLYLVKKILLPATLLAAHLEMFAQAAMVDQLDSCLV